MQSQGSVKRDQLGRGELVEILPAYAAPGPPVSLLFAAGKGRSPKVRAFIDWMLQRWEKHAST